MINIFFNRISNFKTIRIIAFIQIFAIISVLSCNEVSEKEGSSKLKIEPKKADSLNIHIIGTPYDPDSIVDIKLLIIEECFIKDSVVYNDIENKSSDGTWARFRMAYDINKKTSFEVFISKSELQVKTPIIIIPKETTYIYVNFSSYTVTGEYVIGFN